MHALVRIWHGGQKVSELVMGLLAWVLITQGSLSQVGK